MLEISMLKIATLPCYTANLDDLVKYSEMWDPLVVMITNCLDQPE